MRQPPNEILPKWIPILSLNNSPLKLAIEGYLGSLRSLDRYRNYDIDLIAIYALVSRVSEGQQGAENTGGRRGEFGRAEFL